MKKIGLLPRIIIALLLGIVIGSFLPGNVVRIFVTFANIFSLILKFVIPLMIITFIAHGVSNLSEGASKLIGATLGISYISTLLAGTIAFFVSSNIFPSFGIAGVENINPEKGMLSSYFTIPINPMFDVTGSVIFAFIVGIGVLFLRKHSRGKEIYDIVSDAQFIIHALLAKVIVPFLPFYILGVFANLAYSKSIIPILSVFGKVFLVVITLHILYILFLIISSAITAKKNPLTIIKNQAPAYFTAVGTQSSAATIPVNLIASEKNGVSEQIRNFVIPLCATIHLAGSMITITSCSVAVLIMTGGDVHFAKVLPFICMLGIAMVAAPGAPGGAIMAALPFLHMIGIDSEALQGLMIALYITQDSFGTAANVSGDSAIAVFIDWLYKRKEA